MGRLPLRLLAPALLLGALFLRPGFAAALFDAGELDALETEPLFDSEYFLDLRGFSYPMEWDELWADTPGVGYRVNSASLDRSDLFIEQEARIPQRLNDWMAFRYDLEHRGDKDTVNLHNWINLIFGPFRNFTFALFGEPQFAKEDADIGLRTAYAFGDKGSFYVGANAVDFNFNKRGRTTQRYDKRPYTYMLGGDLSLLGGSLSADAEFDTPLVRRVPDTNRIYKYRSSRLSLAWKGPLAGWNTRVGYVYGFKRESDNFSPDPLFKTLEFHRGVHMLSAVAGRPWGDKNLFEAGADLMMRRARADYPGAPLACSGYTRWEFMPYGRWRREVKPWLTGEAALFLSFGERRRIYDADAVVSETDNVVEAKLGLGPDFVFAPGSRLALYATFDLDDAGRHIWDGGNIRAIFLF
ncbi:MAG: hypothetical protein ABIJ96_13475 [Elusimicrobiota bacterium]